MEDKSGKLKSLSNEKLIDAVKNHIQYGYDEDLRKLAIATLEERGISKDFLKFTGNYENRIYKLAKKTYDFFELNSKIAFLIYIILIITNLTTPFISKGVYIPELILLTNLVLLTLYAIFLIRSFILQGNFYKIIKKPHKADGSFLYLFLGMPLYLLMYFYFRNRMHEQMKQIQ
ncbi:MAG: hypothetical protein ACK4ND_19570 [Cytophagaceae bacterium]